MKKEEARFVGNIKHEDFKEERSLKPLRNLVDSWVRWSDYNEPNLLAALRLVSQNSAATAKLVKLLENFPAFQRARDFKQSDR